MSSLGWLEGMLRAAEHFPVESYVREEMEARDLTPGDLAGLMGITTEAVEGLLNEGMWDPTSYPAALERVFGIDSLLWRRFYLSDLALECERQWKARKEVPA